MDCLHYALFLACLVLFGLLVPAMCSGTLCVQVHELTQTNSGDNRKDTHYFHNYTL